MLDNIAIQNYPKIDIHLANSAGTLLGSDFHFDMVRVGLSMYGYLPSHTKYNLKLKQALFLTPNSCICTEPTPRGRSFV